MTELYRIDLGGVAIRGEVCNTPIIEVLDSGDFSVRVVDAKKGIFDLEAYLPEDKCITFAVGCSGCSDCPVQEFVRCLCEDTSECKDCETCAPSGFCESTCPEDFYCSFNRCVECDAETPCPGDKNCIGGRCVCPDSKPVSINGVCLECLEDAPCATCYEGSLIPIICNGACDPSTGDCVECLETGDCYGEFEICSGKQCVCSTGYIRNEAGDCVEEPECGGGNDCPDCFNCQGGVCVPNDCPGDGDICLGSNGCVSGCVEDEIGISVCADPTQVCVSTPSGSGCIDCEGDCETGCGENCYCDGERCVANICHGCSCNCVNESDCPEGYGCDGEKCVPCASLSCDTGDCENILGCECCGDVCKSTPPPCLDTLTLEEVGSELQATLTGDNLCSCSPTDISILATRRGIGDSINYELNFSAVMGQPAIQGVVRVSTVSRAVRYTVNPITGVRTNPVMFINDANITQGRFESNLEISLGSLVLPNLNVFIPTELDFQGRVIEETTYLETNIRVSIFSDIITQDGCVFDKGALLGIYKITDEEDVRNFNGEEVISADLSSASGVAPTFTWVRNGEHLTETLGVFSDGSYVSKLSKEQGYQPFTEFGVTTNCSCLESITEFQSNSCPEVDFGYSLVECSNELFIDRFEVGDLYQDTIFTVSFGDEVVTFPGGAPRLDTRFNSSIPFNEIQILVEGTSCTQNFLVERTGKPNNPLPDFKGERPALCYLNSEGVNQTGILIDPTSKFPCPPVAFVIGGVRYEASPDVIVFVDDPLQTVTVEYECTCQTYTYTTESDNCDVQFNISAAVSFCGGAFAVRIGGDIGFYDIDVAGETHIVEVSSSDPNDTVGFYDLQIDGLDPGTYTVVATPVSNPSIIETIQVSVEEGFTITPIKTSVQDGTNTVRVDPTTIRGCSLSEVRIVQDGSLIQIISPGVDYPLEGGNYTLEGHFLGCGCVAYADLYMENCDAMSVNINTDDRDNVFFTVDYAGTGCMAGFLSYFNPDTQQGGNLSEGNPISLDTGNYEWTLAFQNCDCALEEGSFQVN